MEAGGSSPTNAKAMNVKKLTLFAVNCILLTVGNTGGPLLLRLYYIKGGSRKWLSSWLVTGAWPVLLIPLFFNYCCRHRQPPKENDPEESSSSKQLQLTSMTRSLFFSCLVLGVIIGLVDYLYAFGAACLPVSTLAILSSSRLAFQSLFSLFIMKQKFTACSVNAVVLLLIGSVVLGVHAKSRDGGQESESSLQYMVGFVVALAAAAIYGAVLPLIELACARAKQAVSYSLVVEMQAVMGFSATTFCTVGMILDNDFYAIPREAKEFILGESKYYVLLVFSGIIWQFFFLGAVGIIACYSNLHVGVVVSALLPVTETLAVFFFKEKFTIDKGISLVICVWGFVSYFYGEYKKNMKEKKETKEEGEELQTT